MRSNKIDFNNVIPIFGTIDESSAKSVLGKLHEYASKPDVSSIDLMICSSGGSVDWGVAIVETIRMITEYKQIIVRVIGLSHVASMAASIWLSVPMAQRILTKKTRVYFHPTKTSAKLAFDYHRTTATVEEIEEALGIIKRTTRYDDELIAQLLKETKLPIKRVRNNVSKGWMLTADEAREMNLVGEII